LNHPQFARRSRLGVDIGGTFTDFALVDAETGASLGLKVPSDSADPVRAVAAGLGELRARGVDLGTIEYFVHGTTIAVNSIIQRSGARIALLVTDGFRDVLELGRLRLPVPWSFYSRRPAALVPRELVVPVRERIRHDGEVEVPLEHVEVDRVVESVAALGVEGVAICLLHAYVDGTHERKLRDGLIRRAPSLFVTCSCEIWPQPREYERALVTAMNAYVRPAMVRYLAGLEATLRDAGIRARPYIARSNGGIMSTGAARDEPVQTLLSGPASGVIGATDIALRAGFRDLLTLDMGGTSADVAVVEQGEIGSSHDGRVGDLPVIVPAVAISSIGAGGGSVAWLDATGVLKVGPRSAGARPGPASYCLGGEEPTLTDAFLVCGYLDAERFAGGLRLDAEAAGRALGTIAPALARSRTEAAEAIVRVALANMYAELTGVLDRRGLDPRAFTLVAFGGAGPLVACLLAEEMNIGGVLVPPLPGTLCAQGALRAAAMTDIVRTVREPLSQLDGRQLAAAFAPSVERGRAWLEREAPTAHRTELRLSAEMRYIGQAYELEVPVRPEWLERSALGPLATAFHDLHERVFFHADREAPVEVVDLRVRAVGLVDHPPDPAPLPPSRQSPRPEGRRRVLIGGGLHDTPVYARAALAAGDELDGPLVVHQSDATTLIPPGWNVMVDSGGNLLASRKVRDAN